MHRFLFALVVCAVAAPAAFAQGGESYALLRQPALSRTEIAFSYAGDIWIVDRAGGDARRLTSSPGTEGSPLFSPDGSQIVFTGEYDGNTDVYLVPSKGGVPRRLTYHPAGDTALGWTPDGKRILFRSSRYSYADFTRLYTIPTEGETGISDELPLPVAFEGSYSSDGSHIAYVPNLQWQEAWKRYRGGQTTPVWIASLADSSIEKLPRENSNDSQPVWVGDTIYFLSDRNGPVTLFAYDTKSKAVRELVKNGGFDLKSVSAGPGALVYEQFGAIHLYDTASGSDTRVNIRVAGDLPEVRPGFRRVPAQAIQNARISPTGARAVFEARGEILTVPSSKGDVRNITNTTGAAERDPEWSPDGKRIAYFSDASGEYALHIKDQTGAGDAKIVDLGAPPSFFYMPSSTPAWSPDSKRLVFTDKRLTLWYVDADTGKPVKVDTDRYEMPARTLDPAWSPDGKWIAYTKRLPNFLRAVFVYSLDQRRSFQVTDGMSDTGNPVFDASGKYLYFTASTNIGPGSSWLDMSSMNRPVTRSVYVAVLDKTLPSPLAPESDEEKGPDAKKDDAKPADAPKPATDPAAPATPPAPPAPPVVKIDVEDIGQRVLAMPIPAKNYVTLFAGKEGKLFLVEGPLVPGDDAVPSAVTRFDLSKRKVEPVADGVTWFDLSANGEKMLIRQGEQWFIAASEPNFKPAEGALRLADVQVYVDPRAEWRQIYREVWRIQRDFFYDPKLHGLDLKTTMARYQPYVDNVGSRADLNYVFVDMLGLITAGHVFVGGGDTPDAKPVPGGLLGADFSIENGRYRVARVYNGENWNPEVSAPLTQPGVNVKAGEYLIAVRGREITSKDNVYQALEGTAGKQIVVKVGPTPDGAGAREVTVVPIASEQALRRLAWIEGNRRKVDELSNGRVAYVQLPDTGSGGYTSFNRYFFAQVGKEGAVLDERFNHGGSLADYIVDLARRPPMSRIAGREGEDQTSPAASIYGPKAMIINEMAGSGGDAMPWYFRKAGVGPLVGKRTWGGLIGIFDYPPLVDGGFVTAPRVALYGLGGEWEVENRGIAPDVEVEFDPKAWRQGHDLQLERAVQVVMEALGKSPLPTFKRPAYPTYR